MIASIPELKESGTQFVFVPAMSDVGSLSVYPRLSLHSPVTEQVNIVVRKNAWSDCLHDHDQSQ